MLLPPFVQLLYCSVMISTGVLSCWFVATCCYAGSLERFGPCLISTDTNNFLMNDNRSWNILNWNIRGLNAENK